MVADDLYGNTFKKFYTLGKEGTLYKVRSKFLGFRKMDLVPINIGQGEFVVYLGVSTIHSESLSDVADYKPKFLFNDQIIIASSAVMCYEAHFLEKMCNQ